MNEIPYLDKKGRIYKYGEFFPIELSPFAYNETLAQEFFVKSVKEAKEDGYSWTNDADKNYVPTKRTNDLPNRIEEVSDEIVNEIVECEHQGKCNDRCATAFRITEKELQFYRRMKIPLPRLCPNCRHFKRLEQRTLLQTVHKNCQCAGNNSDGGIYNNTVEHPHGDKPCSNEFETNYTSDTDIIYCENCYKKEVY